MNIKKHWTEELNSQGAWVNGADFHDSINYAYPHFTGRSNLEIEKLALLFVHLFVCLLLFTCAVTPCHQFELFHCMLETKFSFVFVVVFLKSV